MKRSWILSIIALTITCFSLNIHAANHGTTMVPTDVTKPVVVTPMKPRFTIILASNPTTGFSWFLKNYNARLLTLVDHKFQHEKSTLIGSGGFEIWTFRANPAAFLAPSITDIQLVYMRPWNTEEAKVTHIAVVSRVIHRRMD